MTRHQRLAIVVAAFALSISACGDGAGPGATTSTTATSSTSASTTTSTTLPGEPSELGPPAGGTVAVVGVAFDDQLNVRSGPGASTPVVATLGPTDRTTATGNNRMLDDISFWYEVDVDGVTGWASAAFLLGYGSTDDITARVVSMLGSRPTAATMLELGRIVADTQASADVTSTIVVVAPSSGDMGEVTYDVIGLADDSLGGLRLHVFGQPGEGGFSLKSVEATSLCARGFGPPGDLCP